MNTKKKSSKKVKQEVFFKLKKNGKLENKSKIKIEKKYSENRLETDKLREKLTDNELVEIVMNENLEVYRILFKRYEKSLFIYMFHLIRNKDEVQDLLQDVFTKTYKNLNKFDLDRKFSSWIYRISHNEAVNFIKKNSKRRTVSWEEINVSKDKLVANIETANGAEIFAHKEIVAEMDDALDMLPVKYRKILELRYFDEYSYFEIGKIIGKPVNTVGTLINRAKKKLAEIVRIKGIGY